MIGEAETENIYPQDRGHPKASVIDEMEIRLSDQLYFSTIGAFREGKGRIQILLILRIQRKDRR